MAKAKKFMDVRWEKWRLPPDPRLDGWEEVQPFMVPEGSVVSIVDVEESWLGSWTEGREALILRLRIEPPDQPPIENAWHWSFRKIGRHDLSQIGGLTAYMKAIGPNNPSGFLDSLVAISRGKDAPTWSAPGGPELPFIVAKQAGELAARYQEIIEAAAKPDDQITLYHPANAKSVVEEAYLVGRLIRELELHALYEKEIDTVRRRSRKGGKARGDQMKANASDWQAQCRMWAQGLVDNWSEPKPPTKGMLANLIIAKWENRGFEGGPFRPKGEDLNSPPAYDTLTLELIPKWKKDGFRGLRP